MMIRRAKMNIKQLQQETLGFARFISLVLFVLAVVGVLLTAVLFTMKVINKEEIHDAAVEAEKIELAKSKERSTKASAMFDEVVSGGVSSKEGLDLANAYVDAIEDNTIDEDEFDKIKEIYTLYQERKTPVSLQDASVGDSDKK